MLIKDQKNRFKNMSYHYYIMPAEDFEEDYITDEKNFAAVIYGLGWSVLSIPFMFVYMFLMTGMFSAILATAALITIYVIFILIELRFS